MFIIFNNVLIAKRAAECEARDKANYEARAGERAIAIEAEAKRSAAFEAEFNAKVEARRLARIQAKAHDAALIAKGKKMAEERALAMRLKKENKYKKDKRAKANETWLASKPSNSVKVQDVKEVKVQVEVQDVNNKESINKYKKVNEEWFCPSS